MSSPETNPGYSEFYDLLKELAMDLHWAWSHATDKVWRLLDPVLWELTHNPFAVLQTVSKKRISEVMQDGLIRDLILDLVKAKHQRAISPAWFQHHHAQKNITHIAYFSMEFMLSEVLPIYSGGLGNVAGDHLKTASDLGVPLVGVGLLFQQAYSRQVIFPDGSQQYIAPCNDPSQLPVTPLRSADGEWIRIKVQAPGYLVWLRTWEVKVGRTTFYLLYSNDAAIFPVYRGITNELYTSGSEHRFLQELVLGIGGWLLLRELGIHPEVCHLNEGHSAVVVEDNGCSFGEALLITRAGNIFTTHTAVGAGFDLFTPELITRYLGDYINSRLKITVNDFLALGRKNPHDEKEPFNTAYLAINGSCYVNGVSQLHRQMSQQIFSPLFPRWPLHEVPVGAVTNGVHMPTWDSPEADDLWTEACGKERWLGTLEGIEPDIYAIPNERLWAMRKEGKRQFFQIISQRYKRQMEMSGSWFRELNPVEIKLDPSVFTMGFARRFVSYKRPNLLLKDHLRLKRILCNEEKPVQLVMAGKAHRGDPLGQSYIKEWIDFVRMEGLQSKVIFLSDYDMLLCEQLVQGVDLWINTPRRPWEACGTSGLKVLVNGGLNLSVLDGWWEEAYTPEVGWAISGANNDQDLEVQDWKEAEQVYDLLENEIIPEFYRRKEAGFSEAWVARIKKSMATLTPRFSANRSLREYTENFYLPAGETFIKRAADSGKYGKKLFLQKQQIVESWTNVGFGKVTTRLCESGLMVEAEVQLPASSILDYRVELFAEGKNGKEAEIYPMIFQDYLQQAPCIALYRVEVATKRPVTDYTTRIRPYGEGFLFPMECPLIRWQH